MRLRNGAEWKRWATVTAAILLAGCFQLGRPTPEVRTFRLSYVADPPTGKPLPLILRVSSLEVSDIYDRDPIVYREGDYSIGTYFYYRWASNPGDMIGGLLARDFAKSGLYRDVQSSVSIEPPDYQLKGTVEDIEERIKDHDCSAHLRLRFTLTATSAAKEDRIRLTKDYEGEEPCRCDDPESIAKSMSTVMSSISTQLQADVYTTLAAT